MAEQERHGPWLWPNRRIGKLESRLLREEHNATVNSHADLLAACEDFLAVFDTCRELQRDGLTVQPYKQAAQTVAAAIAKATP